MSPSTIVLTKDQFAAAAKSKNICVPFRSLHLQGPEGEFQAEGMLVSRSDNLYIECCPLPHDGSSVPWPKAVLQTITIGPGDFWTIDGITLLGLRLVAANIAPPMLEWRQEGGFTFFTIPIHLLEVGETKRWTPYNKKAPPKVEIWADFQNTKLKLLNAGSEINEENSAGTKTRRSKADSFVGALKGWKYYFRQVEESVVLELKSDEEYDALESDSDIAVFDGVRQAFAFIQGQRQVPWRLRHSRCDAIFADKYNLSEASTEHGAIPIGGPSALSRGADAVGVEMFEKLAVFFASGEPLAADAARYHCEMLQVCDSHDLRLYQCLHMCAILEGLAKSILKHRTNGTPTRVSERTPMSDKFKAAAEAVGLEWDGQFEGIVSLWKTARNALAHGSFFGQDGLLDRGIFDLFKAVGAGVLALILRSAGWDKRLDFKAAMTTGFFYY